MADLDTLPCPGCHTPLPPEATGCQICMRVRTKQEIVRGYAKLREERARRKRRPYQIAAALLVVGGVARLSWLYRAPVASAVSEAASKVSRWADEMRDPKHYAPQLDSAEAPPPESEAVAPMRPPDPTPAPSPEPAPAPAAGPAIPNEPGTPEPPPENAWHVTGTVYDLATLAPVEGAGVTFLFKDDKPVSAVTDAKGGYAVYLPKAGGWTVGLASPMHRVGGVLDIDPPYRVRDADERRATHRYITDGDLTPSPVDWPVGRDEVKLDLVAVPHRWPEPSAR